MYGSGNSHGYYEIFQNEDLSKNAFYTDYKTKQQVYLCAQPNCMHTDSTCTSYLPPASESVQIAPTDTELFWVYSGFGGSGSRIEKSDLDGSNRVPVYEFPANTELATGVAYNGTQLAVFGTSYMEQKNGDVAVKPSLYVIDINCQKCQTVQALEPSTQPAYEPGATSMFFFGTTESGFVVKTITAGSTEMDENGNLFETTPTHHTLYEIPFDGSAIKTLLEFDQGECYEELSGAYLYYLANHGEGHYALERIDGATGEKTTVIHDFQECEGGQEIASCAFTGLYLDEFFDDYVIVKALVHNDFNAKGDLEMIFHNYAVDLRDLSITQITLSNYYAATEVPIEILAESGDSLFVAAVVEEEESETRNFKFERIYRMALISKEDYLHSDPNYLFIDATRNRR